VVGAFRSRSCTLRIGAQSKSMKGLSDPAIERVEVREVTGLFRSLQALDAATSELLHTGFDRADLDVMGDVDEVVRKLRTAKISAGELSDLTDTPRRPLIRPEDVVLMVACVAGIAGFIAAAISAWVVVASGGGPIAAAFAALAGGVPTGMLAALLSHSFVGRDPNADIRALVEAGGIVLWVRVRSPEQERQALEILARNGARPVRIHQIAIEKRQEDLPLSTIRPDPWLGGHRLGDIDR
jgi:hypothetical protein